MRARARSVGRFPDHADAEKKNLFVFPSPSSGITAPADQGGLGLGYSEHVIALEVRSEW